MCGTNDGIIFSGGALRRSREVASRSDRSSGSTVFFLLVDLLAFFGVVAAAEVLRPAFFCPPALVAIGATAEEDGNGFLEVFAMLG